jgi:hypothetical protein
MEIIIIMYGLMKISTNFWYKYIFRCTRVQNVCYNLMVQFALAVEELALAILLLTTLHFLPTELFWY